MITGVDHVVILVADLRAAMRSYTMLGFAVEAGGEHPRWGTENALIPLADGSYLELLAARDRSRAAGHRLWRRPDGGMREPGEYGGFMVGSDDLSGDVARLRAHGLVVQDPSPGARVRLDGQEVRWRLAFPERRDLPALIEDETPRPLRVPTPAGGLNVHARLVDVTVISPHVQEAARAFALMLGVPHRADDRTGDRRFAMPVGGITVVAPPPGHPGFDDLRRTGPGVFSITLAVQAHGPRPAQGAPADQTPPNPLDPRATGGVRIFLRETAGPR